VGDHSQAEEYMALEDVALRASSLKLSLKKKDEDGSNKMTSDNAIKAKLMKNLNFSSVERLGILQDCAETEKLKEDF
jgi:hypothetical protein